MHLTFLGAVETVTGSRFLLDMDGRNALIDCGIFQGGRQLRRRNWDHFPISPADIDFVVLTHAHIDHSGYLPLLVKNGFTGKVYCSAATLDLCSLLLPDSGFIQEEEARRANLYGYSKHSPAVPLYTRIDAVNSLKQFHVLNFRKKYRIEKDINVTLIPAGHILGSSMVDINFRGISVLFSGDLGRPDDPVIPAPDIIKNTDYLVLESTYGDRLHDKQDPLDRLADIVQSTFSNNGTVVIPSFAVGRSQHILFLLYQLKKQKRLPDIPIFLDSPMAKSATEIFRKHNNLHKLDKKTSHDVCEIATYTNTSDESKELDALSVPKIIISASGMLEGGRILHHVKTFAADSRNTIIFTGFQAPGTRGDEIINGKKQIKIFGELVQVNAKIEVLENMSAHADYAEILQWLSNFDHPPRKVFITHGEPSAANSMSEKIKQNLHWQVVVPKLSQTENL